MKIGIIGSGIVGQVLGGKLVELGHDVTIGTRDPAKLEEKKGNAGSLNGWIASTGGKGRVGTFAEAAAHGKLLLNATNGTGSLEALQAAGAANLGGKVLIDISNPLDFSKGMPPTLFVKDTDSLAEQIQRAFPGVKVVKSFNTMSASVMVDPKSVAGGDSTVFLSGNDEAAKAQAAELLRSFGWTDIFDLGDLSSARGAEMLLPIWLRAWGKLGSAPFNFKIAR